MLTKCRGCKTNTSYIIHFLCESKPCELSHNFYATKYWLCFQFDLTLGCEAKGYFRLLHAVCYLLTPPLTTSNGRNWANPKNMPIARMCVGKMYRFTLLSSRFLNSQPWFDDIIYFGFFFQISWKDGKSGQVLTTATYNSNVLSVRRRKDWTIQCVFTVNYSKKKKLSPTKQYFLCMFSFYWCRWKVVIGFNDRVLRTRRECSLNIPHCHKE